ncbi:MAG: hypothetical protein KF683_01405 [Rubrivivax sp.]|nr:hypothetical protein [Rubrivivax sp.]
MQLLRRQPDGSTLLQHLQRAAELTGQPDPRLQRRVPPAGAALWDAFCELAAARPAAMGAGAVPMTEVLAWQQLHGVRLTPWEVGTLLAMDRAALAAIAPAPRAGGAQA